MKQMQKLGPLKDILKLMPGMGSQLENFKMDGDEMGKMEAIIHSMNKKEREDPELIDISRRRRIARGSGTQLEDVSGLVKSFTMAAQMMKKMSGMGIRDRMNFAKNIGKMDMSGGGPQFKTKIRSHRKTKKERERDKKKRRR
jgi:signal recognition particle subunit SRP54